MRDTRKTIGPYIYIHTHNAHRIFQKVTSSKIKLIKFREEFVVTLIREEIQPVLKKMKLQELHYLASLPPTEKKNSVRQRYTHTHTVP